MSEVIINVLIRNKYRPELFGRCMKSVAHQTIIERLRVIVVCDSIEALEQAVKFKDKLPCEVTVIDAIIDTSFPYYWNLYSNQLKALVTQGWFFFLDNDDVLHMKNSLESISKELTNQDEGVICQMIRNGNRKPAREYMQRKKIVSGKIGAPCLFLHHSKKNIAMWDGEPAADYRWIKDVEQQLPMKFVPIVVVKTGNNGLHGK